MIVDLDLSLFSITEFIGIPSDASCPAAIGLSEHCVIPQLAPGETKNFTLLVTARPTAETTASLTALTSSIVLIPLNKGRVQMISQLTSAETSVTPTMPKIG